MKMEAVRISDGAIIDMDKLNGYYFQIGEKPNCSGMDEACNGLNHAIFGVCYCPWEEEMVSCGPQCPLFQIRRSKKHIRGFLRSLLRINSHEVTLHCGNGRKIKNVMVIEFCKAKEDA